MRRALARKYLCGLQPGFRLVPGLGGNTRHLPPAQAADWRRDYLRARAASGVAGFAFFDFRFENGPAVVVLGLLRELAPLLV